MKKYNITPNETPEILESIQHRAGYYFRDSSLMLEAFTHSSYAAEQKDPIPHNQRLEFLGDAVLQILVSDLIYHRFPELQEGVLTKLRSSLTDEPANIGYTRALELDLALLLGKGEASTGGRSKPATLGDLFEAFLAAVYLDGGLEAARRVLLPLLPDLDEAMGLIQDAKGNDPKGALQNIVVTHLHEKLRYEVVEVSGPCHNPTFTSVVMLGDCEIGRGTATSKKESEKVAAKFALDHLDTFMPPEASSTEPEEVAGEVRDSKPVVSSGKFPAQKRFLALDFDGVICDSAGETACSGWLAARRKWPDKFHGDQAPPEIIDAFRRVRPYLETGYQSILMLRMLVDGCDESLFSKGLSERLLVMMSDLGVGKSELISLFGDVRDNWIRDDLPSWLSCQGAYPGAVEALGKACSKHNVVILTTKQERFVSAWLESVGISLPSSQIYGLDRKEPKEETLSKFVAENRRNIHFVEDRLPTLLRVLGYPGLKRVRLHYADWGYGTPEELKCATSHAGINVLTLPDFLSLLE